MNCATEKTSSHDQMNSGSDTTEKSIPSEIEMKCTLQATYETQRRRVMGEAQEYIRQKIVEYQNASKTRMDEFLDEKENLKNALAEKEDQIKSLNDEIDKLKKEVESGKSIIQQFSELVKDKTSSVCRYCRRSGTLPPIPLR